MWANSQLITFTFSSHLTAVPMSCPTKCPAPQNVPPHKISRSCAGQASPTTDTAVAASSLDLHISRPWVSWGGKLISLLPCLPRQFWTPSGTYFINLGWPRSMQVRNSPASFGDWTQTTVLAGQPTVQLMHSAIVVLCAFSEFHRCNIFLNVHIMILFSVDLF